MIFQATITVSWLLGVGIMFGLSFLMTVLTNKNVETFFIYLTIFSGFVVWSGLLPLWILVICVIILTLIMINKTSKRGMV